MYGKVINNELVMSGEVLITETEQIFNAKHEMWIANGWKPVYWDQIDDAEKEYIQVTEETEDSIFIHWSVL